MSVAVVLAASGVVTGAVVEGRGSGAGDAVAVADPHSTPTFVPAVLAGRPEGRNPHSPLFSTRFLQVQQHHTAHHVLSAFSFNSIQDAHFQLLRGVFQPRPTSLSTTASPFSSNNNTPQPPNKLPSTHRFVSTGADLIAEGTEPCSALLARSREVRAVRPDHSPGSLGMEPVRPLPLRLLVCGNLVMWW